jgi:hypothetical protein
MDRRNLVDTTDDIRIDIREFVIAKKLVPANHDFLKAI